MSGKKSPATNSLEPSLSSTICLPLIKSLFFGFIIASISAFYGYYAYGGALNVGKASTNAVVNSSIVILLMNIVLTQLLLV